jgi:hypothetical protein
MRRRLLGALALVLVTTTSAHAQVSEERLADYRAAAERGVAAYNADDLEAARAHFERAIAVLPNQRAYRLLGRVALAQERYVEAAQLFHRALSTEDTGHSLTEQLRREVETVLLQRTREHVAEYRLDLQPADAIVTVDGRAAAIVAGRLILEPGAHTVVAEAPARMRLERRVQAAPGMREILPLHLEPANDARDPLGTPRSDRGSEPSSAPVPEPEPAAQRDEPGARELPGIVSMAVGGVLAASIIGTAVWWIDRDDVIVECNRLGCLNGDALVAERDAAAGTTVALGVLALAGIGVGAALIATASDAVDGEQVRVRCAPSFGGLSCVGTF